ncbi:hypothetical protein B566_EDAN003123 [Ephemera danica]|nr:hypothetical protein B566_EDAN003123 [Ephemera danica]
MDDTTVTKPNQASEDDLLKVHSKNYLNSLKLTMIFSRYQVGGSILAGKLALERGWAINLGGGFHHCSKFQGGGFCSYADITLLINSLFTNMGQQVSSVMILDLDAHQGIIRRDEMVFASASEEKVPIVMLTSGGYQKQTARIIADSILNLHAKGLLPQL